MLRARCLYCHCAVALLLTGVAGCAANWFDSAQSLELADQINLALMVAFTAAWLFFFGAAVGSFLNVVAWRLPLGMNLVRPGSMCPACRTPIKWHDNLPVIGWLKLRGRCRACRVAIPPRYPIVEAVMGGMFLVLAVAEVWSGGASLPIRPEQRTYQSVANIWALDSYLLRVLVFHCLLVSFLMAWLLIQSDGKRVPKTLFLIYAGIALPALLYWPSLHPLPPLASAPDWLRELGAPELVRPVRGLLNATAGCLLGALVGCAFAWGCLPDGWDWPSETRADSYRSDLAGGWAIIGMYLGWRAAVVAGVLAVINLGAATLVVRRGTNPLGAPARHTLVAVLAQILAWRHLAWIVRTGHPAFVVAEVCAAITLIYCLGRGVRHLQPIETPDITRVVDPTKVNAPTTAATIEFPTAAGSESESLPAIEQASATDQSDEPSQLVNPHPAADAPPSDP